MQVVNEKPGLESPNPAGLHPFLMSPRLLWFLHDSFGLTFCLRGNIVLVFVIELRAQRK